MHIFQIKYREKLYFVPLIYPGDISTGIWRNFPPSISQLRAFRSSETARDFLNALGYGNKIDAIVKINLDNIRQWASNPEFEKVALSDLEQLEGLLNTYFVEVEKHLPDDVDTEEVPALLGEIFYEPKLAQLKLADASIATDDNELQRKINNPKLKTYYLALIRHFERVVYLNDRKNIS
jgi:hypothetical protein